MNIDFTQLKVLPGRPYPMGCTVYGNAVRFSIFSRHAQRVWLAIFAHKDDRVPAWEFEMDARRHRIGDVWSVFVDGLNEGAYYLYRMDGPHAPGAGHRFDATAYLLDPMAKAFVGDLHQGLMKCVVVHDAVGWNHDPRPRVPMEDTVIYEAHVRGLTVSPSAGVEHPGTYTGLIEKIPYLKELGVTAVELLPIHEFGENLLGRCSVLTGRELTNYWGYSNIGFFAPSGRYAVSWEGRHHVDEFRGMVRAMHNAGLEVILDVVFNHTSEGNERGPTLCFRGIDNAIYYLLDKDGDYQNFSGCGNTVNCNHPLVRDFILDCLRYWVAVMHIDGFRFDLASILGRDRNGVLQQDMPLIERIAEDPVLRDTKLIAEAWDAGGAYQVGSFGDARWAEWNGQYRDDVRRYWRNDGGLRGIFASRMSGSSDLYAASGRGPEHTINFITCHDGFTLRDLVTYTTKRNWANGEGNQDGANENYSMHCGVEGETADPAVNALRLRMQKNHLATLFLSVGVPMLLGGDEFGRTQQGNNNAYCQDNEISWFDWTLVETNAELVRFCKAMIAFRRDHAVFRRTTYFHEDEVQWRAPSGTPPDWGAEENALALSIPATTNGGLALCLLFNPGESPVDFVLPPGAWRRCIYTAGTPPDDLCTCAVDAVQCADLFACEAQAMAVLCTGAVVV